MNNPGPAPVPLSQWFSSARMSRYADHPAPEALYLWNTHLTKTYLADIEHLEVLLRNCIHAALTRRYSERWFDNGQIKFSNKAGKSICKAKGRAGGEGAPPGKIIAELSFDFWRFLLSSYYQANIWPQVEKTLKKKPNNRQQFEGLVVTVYKMRNRCSHHESMYAVKSHISTPLITPSRRWRTSLILMPRHGSRAIPESPLYEHNDLSRIPQH